MVGSEFVNSPDEQCLLGDKDCDRFLLEQSQKRGTSSCLTYSNPPLIYTSICVHIHIGITCASLCKLLSVTLVAYAEVARTQT